MDNHTVKNKSNKGTEQKLFLRPNGRKVKEVSKMRRIEELEKELLNKEVSFMELDNVMVKNGFYSVLDDGTYVEYIKRDGNVIYTGLESAMCEIKITFEITIDNGEDEGTEAFYLKVTSVENF